MVKSSRKGSKVNQSRQNLLQRRDVKGATSFSIDKIKKNWLKTRNSPEKCSYIGRNWSGKSEKEGQNDDNKEKRRQNICFSQAVISVSTRVFIEHWPQLIWKNTNFVIFSLLPSFCGLPKGSPDIRDLSPLKKHEFGQIGHFHSCMVLD